MGILQGLVAWTEQVFLPIGPLGLFIVAFIESSFFPVPPDLLIIALVLADPAGWIFYASVATVGSAAGAVLGYGIGVKGGRPVLLHFCKEKTISKMEGYFARYGDWAIAIAAFTPIPYKIFTIAAGVFRHSCVRMVLISIPSRGARFFLVAGIIAFWGTELLVFFETSLGIATIIMCAAIFGVWYFWRKNRHGQHRHKAA